MVALPLRLIVSAYLLASFVMANTEVYMFTVPNYYEIPSGPTQQSPELALVNATTRHLDIHPVLTIDTYNIEDTVVTLPYDFHGKPQQRLLVKLNNFENSVYSANDLVHTKLCWPATSPFDIRISHGFFKEQDILGTGSAHLDMYLIIDYTGNFHAVREVSDDSFSFMLVVSKLPNKLPIPIELYDYIGSMIALIVFISAALPTTVDFLINYIGRTDVPASPSSTRNNIARSTGSMGAPRSSLQSNMKSKLHSS